MNISPNTQHILLGQVSNGLDKLLQYSDYGPRGERQQINFLLILEAEALVVADATHKTTLLCYQWLVVAKLHLKMRTTSTTFS